MALAIGFANKFYTLWSVEKSPVYLNGINGTAYIVGYNIEYTYHKNISFDLDTTKALYPNVEVHEDLKGTTTSWKSENKEDLCPQIMKFGKYYRRDIKDLVKEDFSYLVWICLNRGYTSNGIYAGSLPELKAHFDAINTEEAQKLAATNKAFSDLVNSGKYLFTPSRNLSVCDDSAYMCINDGDLCFCFKFQEGTFSYQEYNGFSYGLPLVSGKAKRIKGKSVTFDFVEDKASEYQVIVTNVRFDEK